VNLSPPLCRRAQGASRSCLGGCLLHEYVWSSAVVPLGCAHPGRADGVYELQWAFGPTGGLRVTLGDRHWHGIGSRGRNMARWRELSCRGSFFRSWHAKHPEPGDFSLQFGRERVGGGGRGREGDRTGRSSSALVYMVHRNAFRVGIRAGAAQVAGAAWLPDIFQKKRPRKSWGQTGSGGDRGWRTRGLVLWVIETGRQSNTRRCRGATLD